MTFVPVDTTAPLDIIESAEWNKLVSNGIDLDSRATTTTGIVTHVTSGNSALNTRVLALETGGVVGLKRAIYPSQNTDLTATASAETDIVKLAVLAMPVTSGVLYRFNYTLNIVGTVAGDVYAIRLRRNNPLVGSLIQAKQHVVAVAGAGPTGTFSLAYTASSTNNIDFYVSIVRLLGSGTAKIYQDADYKNQVEAFHVGVPGGGVITTPA